MAAELEGLIKLGAQRSRRARWRRWRARAQLEAKRPRPVARPYPIKPAGELYAEILLGTGDARAAVVQFKAALARTPGRAAVAARPGARRERRRPAARTPPRPRRTFLAAWHLADKDRPELAEMRALAR